MQGLRIPEENFIKGQQRRASAEITRGIENEIEACHQLHTGKRGLEFLGFSALYLLGAAGAVFLPGFWVCIPIFFMGLALNSLGIFLHEGLHGLLAKRETVNHLLSFLAGLPLGLSATAYQFTHNNHHYDLGRKLDYGTYSQHFKNPKLVWTAYLLQLTLGSVLYVIFIPLLTLKQSSRRTRITVLLEYLLIGTGFYFFFTNLSTEQVLIFWLCPLFVLNILSNIRGLASHALGDPEDIYLSSRSITCPKLISKLFLHENLHLEHHLFPRIPSYHLQQAHELIWPRLPKALAATSYRHFLRMFFKAARKRDLHPQGVTTPHSSPVLS